MAPIRVISRLYFPGTSCPVEYADTTYRKRVEELEARNSKLQLDLQSAGVVPAAFVDTTCHKRVEELEAKNLRLQQELQGVGAGLPVQDVRGTEFELAIKSYMEGLASNINDSSASDASRAKSAKFFEEAKNAESWARIHSQYNEENRMKSRVFTVERTVNLIRGIWDSKLTLPDLPPSFTANDSADDVINRLVDTVIQQRNEEREFTPVKDFSKLHGHEMQSVFNADTELQEAMKNYPCNPDDRSEAALLKFAQNDEIGRSPYDVLIKADRMNTLLHIKNPLALHLSLAERVKICEENVDSLKRRLEAGNHIMDLLLSKYGKAGTQTLIRNSNYDFMLEYIGKRTRRIVESKGVMDGATFKTEAENEYKNQLNDYSKIKTLLQTDILRLQTEDMEIMQRHRRNLRELQTVTAGLVGEFSRVREHDFENLQAIPGVDLGRTKSELAQKIQTLQENVKAVIKNHNRIDHTLKRRASVRREMRVRYAAEYDTTPPPETQQRTILLDGIFELFQKYMKVSTELINIEIEIRTLRENAYQYSKNCKNLSAQLVQLKRLVDTGQTLTYEIKKQTPVQTFKKTPKHKPSLWSNTKGLALMIGLGALGVVALHNNGSTPIRGLIGPPTYAEIVRFQAETIPTNMVASLGEAMGEDSHTIQEGAANCQKVMESSHKKEMRILESECLANTEKSLRSAARINTLENSSANGPLQRTASITFLKASEVARETVQIENIQRSVELNERHVQLAQGVRRVVADIEAGIFSQQSALEGVQMEDTAYKTATINYAKKRTELELNIALLQDNPTSATERDEKISALQSLELTQTSAREKYRRKVDEVPLYDTDAIVENFARLESAALGQEERTAYLALQDKCERLLKAVGGLELTILNLGTSNSEEVTELHRRLVAAQNESKAAHALMQEREFASLQRKDPNIVNIETLTQNLHINGQLLDKVNSSFEKTVREQRLAENASEESAGRFVELTKTKEQTQAQSLANVEAGRQQLAKIDEYLKDIRGRLGMPESDSSPREHPMTDIEDALGNILNFTRQSFTLQDEHAKINYATGLTMVELGEREKEKAVMSQNSRDDPDHNTTLELIHQEQLSLEIIRLKARIKDLTQAADNIIQKEQESNTGRDALVAHVKQTPFCGDGSCTLLEEVRTLHESTLSLSNDDAEGHKMATDAFKKLEEEKSNKERELAALEELQKKTVDELEIQIENAKEATEATRLLVELYNETFIDHGLHVKMLAEDMSKIKTQLEDAEQRARRVENEKHGLNQTIAKRNAQIGNLNAKLSASKKQLRDVSGQIEEDKTTIANLEQKAVIAAKQLSVKDTELNLLTEKFDAANEDSKRLSAEIKTLKSDLSTSQRKLDKLKTEIDAKNALINDHKIEISQLKLELDSAETARRNLRTQLKNMTVALERIQRAVQAFIDHKVEKGREVLEAQLILELEKYKQNMVLELQQRTQILEDEARAHISHAVNETQAAADGAMHNIKGQADGAIYNIIGQAHGEVNRLVLEANGVISGLNHTISELSTRDKLKSDELANLRANAVTSTFNIQMLQETVAAHEKQKTALESTIQLQRTETAKLKEEMETLEKTKSSCTEAVIEYVEKVKVEHVYVDRVDIDTTALDAKKKELEQLTTKHDLLLKETSAIKVKLLEEQQMRTHDLKKSNEDSQARLSDLATQHKMESELSQKAIDDLTQKTTDLTAKVETMEKEYSDLESLADEKAEYCKELEKELDLEIAHSGELYKSLTEHSSTYKKLKATEMTRDTLQRELTAATMVRDTLQRELTMTKSAMENHRNRISHQNGLIIEWKAKYEESQRKLARAQEDKRKFIQKALEHTGPGESYDGTTMTVETAAAILADVEKRKAQQLQDQHHENLQDLRNKLTHCQSVLAASNAKYGLPTLRETTLAQQSPENIAAKEKEHMRQVDIVLGYLQKRKRNDGSSPVKRKKPNEPNEEDE